MLRLPRLLAAAILAAGLCSASAPASADTVADIREELTLLNGQIQQIRDELVRTGAASGLPTAPATALQRLDQLEAALQRLTNRVDVLSNDLSRVVDDASNRVGDIEFRLTELEGGDVSLLGEGAPLGGGMTAPIIPPAPPAPAPPGASAGTAPGFGTGDGLGASAGIGAGIGAQTGAGGAAQLAVGEQADFDAAREAFDAGEHGRAAELFESFLAAYPTGPLSDEAQVMRGEALAAQGDHRAAARVFLDAFSGAPDAPTAPRALFSLAVSLGELGQTEEACLTLTEVTIRYPASEPAREVPGRRGELGCP